MKRPDIFQAGIAFLVGLLFSLGLGISGMTQPQKVIGFLEIGPGWNPALIFVMLAAIPIHFFAFRFIKGQRAPLLDNKLHLPDNQEISKSLIIGSLLFGIGWGLGGYCPGPALASVGGGSLDAIIFTAAMIAGMLLTRVNLKRSQGLN
jgi:uncharacterized membrane protein YedE/YeeE